jgi:hypothetical protein
MRYVFLNTDLRKDERILLYFKELRILPYYKCIISDE